MNKITWFSSCSILQYDHNQSTRKITPLKMNKKKLICKMSNINSLNGLAM